MAGRMIVGVPVFMAGGIILAAIFARTHPDFIAHPPRSAREACDQMIDPSVCHVAGTIEDMRRDRPPSPSDLAVLPDHPETPGAIDPAINPRTLAATICNPVYLTERTPRPSWTAAMRRRLAAKRYPGAAPDNYALDQLVPPSLGGAPSDVRNLWLQSWTGTWNASRKDIVELLLNRMVCARELPLGTAQQMIARDWTEAYRRFVTPQNLAHHRLPERWAGQGGQTVPAMPMDGGRALGPIIIQANITTDAEPYEVPAIPADQSFQQGRE